MDGERFDRWARGFARPRSRRGVLGILTGAALTLAARRGASAQISTPGGMCGGIAGFPCPDGYECVDVAGDGCDPNAGGRDCAGVCVPIVENPCAAILCMEGTTCCPNCGGICVPQGVTCSDELCASTPCNEVTCGPGEYCCNESCSRCVPLGSGCTREYCGHRLGEPCGPNVCGVDEFCCNESCGICAPLGGACIDLYCEPEGEPCGPNVCPAGQVCCNESCGICTPPGGLCPMIACLD
ncbi:MAG: hypothetical protein IT338_05155 [Thermomicrobiales bacterium]|nr:hypothetical protein [Thermomicrobiales bacterium]